MPHSITQAYRRWLSASWRLHAAVALYFLAGANCVSLRAAQAQAPETVGRLSGDDVAVTGAVSFDLEDGRSVAILASGSEITVRSGEARIQLDGGGEIDICGPAHLSLLKSGGAITLALDYGRVHPQLDVAVTLTIYTPFIVATPVAIGQQARNVTIGLDQQGQLCALSAKGAVRIEQQLTGNSLIVPEGGEMSFAGGELNAEVASGACVCQLMVAKSSAPAPVLRELSIPIHPPLESGKPSAPASTPPTEEPIYHVYMPPLTFDASAPAPPPEADPQTILLVREARVRPDVVFQGRVEEAAPGAAPGTDAAMQAPPTPEAKKPGVWARLFGIFHHHKAGTPCVGSGCASSGS